MARHGRSLAVKDEGIVDWGMSGSPIVSMAGKVIALISTDRKNPVLKDTLPSWFFRRSACGPS